MPRFFADEISGGVAAFTEDAPHIYKTLRLSPGDAITAMDGKGGVFSCTITSVGKQRVDAEIVTELEQVAEPGVGVTVYQGICRPHRFEYVAQKCTELGAAKIVPLLLHRCETREYGEPRLQRFRKIAREAAKQSGRSIIPEITGQITPEQIGSHELLLCPYEEEQETRLKDIIAGQRMADVGIVIGPEGGLEPEEAARLREMGGKTLTLGRRILRTETVACTVLAMIFYEMDEV